MKDENLITEQQSKEEAIRIITESAFFDTIFKKIIGFLDANYTQAQETISDGLEYNLKPVVTRKIDEEKLGLDRVLDYMEFRFPKINKEFTKRCIIDWYNGDAQNKGRLTKNIPIFKENLDK